MKPHGQNHDELFPGHVSTLAVTDPELIEAFDNFAFDEALTASGLDTRTRLIVQLAALIGCQALSEYRVMLGAALTAGVTPVEAGGVVYQAVPYAGMGIPDASCTPEPSASPSPFIGAGAPGRWRERRPAR